MKHTIRRKLLSVLLVACMAFTMVPAAFAEDDNEQNNYELTGNNIQQQYSSLKDAIDKIDKDGSGTIKLVQDVTEEKSISIPKNTTVILDLNGHTLTLSGLYTSLNVSGSLIIQDTSQSNNEGKIYGGTEHQSQLILSMGSVELKSGIIITEAAKPAVTVQSAAGSDATFTIQNGTIKGSPAIATVNTLSATINVLGGEVLAGDNSDAISLMQQASLTVGAEDDMGGSEPYIDSIKIVFPQKDSYFYSGTIGSITRDFDKCVFSQNTVFGPNCKFQQDILPFLSQASGKTCVQQADGSFVVETLSTENATARIDDDLFADVMDAADALSTGKILVLLKDVTTSQPINIRVGATIDLNGHALTTNALDAISIVAPVNVMVQNGTIVSNSTVQDDNQYPSGIAIVGDSNGLQGVSLIVDNVDITMNNPSFGIVVNGNNENINITLQNGSSISTDEESLGIYFPPKSGTLTIDNSSVTGGMGIAVKGGNLIVKGNSIITGTGEKNIPTDAQSGGVSSTGDAIYLEGNYENRSASVTVEASTIISKNGKPVQMLFVPETGISSNTKKITVKGGHFSEPIDETYLSSELQAMLTSDDSLAPYSYYPTVDEALINARPGDTVTSVNGEEGATIYTVTLDYGNNTEKTILSLPEGSSFTLPSPTRNDYKLVGWQCDNNVYKGGDMVKVNKDMTFTAIWRETNPPYTGDYNYPVTIGKTEHGTVTIAKEDQWANDGEKITVTVTPDDAYMLDELVIKDKAGNELQVKDNGDGTYTFTMPEGAVTITATFVEDPNWEEPEEPSEPVLPFSDVSEGDWFYDVVEYVYNEGLMTGTSATTFEPNTTTTRGMIVSILHRLEGSPVVTGSDFTDVNDSDWYGQAVAWAASEGIVAGFENGTFQPNAAVTREQMASILYRYAEYKGIDTSARADLSAYSDQPSAWATDVMQWAVAEGLITGTSSDTLDPQGTATRAQVAAMLQRFIENVL